MKQADIDKLPTTSDIADESRQIRHQAPRYIAAIIEKTRAIKTVNSIDELGTSHIKALSGGVDAATYLVNIPDELVIVKMSHDGLKAEAEALSHWHKRGARVPRIIAEGIVPGTQNYKTPVQYLVEEVVLDSNGRPIETCADYLVRHPHNARAVGRAIGHEAAKAHSCVSERKFGEFKRSGGKQSQFTSWNKYIQTALESQKDYLIELGVSESDFDKAVQTVGSHNYVKQGRYLHGDFSIRNAAVKSYDPVKVSLFDPNPIIGDPTWDISFLINNYEFEKHRLEYDDSQKHLHDVYKQIWIGFKQGYDRKIDEIGLASAQLVQAIYQAQYTQSNGDKMGFKARQQYILELVDVLSGLN